MKIAIFGATGKTGMELVPLALDAGHTVKALVRTPDKLGELRAREGLEVIQGDLLNGDDVHRCVEGVDAVVSAAGPVKGQTHDMIVKAANNITSAMQAHSVSRIVWLTGAGVLMPEDPPSFSRALIRGIMGLVAGKVLAASQQAAETVRDTGLEYTILRAPMLGEDESVGYVLSDTAPKPKPLPRVDLARAMLAQLGDEARIKASPMIGVPA